MDTENVRENKQFVWTVEECLKNGGHCYKVSDIVIDTLPETYHRTCKHCGHAQHGHPQPNVAWT